MYSMLAAVSGSFVGYSHPPYFLGSERLAHNANLMVLQWAPLIRPV